MKHLLRSRKAKITSLIALSSLALTTAAQAQLTLWLTGDTGAVADPNNAGHVGEWMDQSGSGLNVFSGNGSSGSNQDPLLVANALNGHSVLRFDGLNTFLSRGDASDSQPQVAASSLVSSTAATIFYVIDPATPTSASGQAITTWLSGGSAVNGYVDNGNQLQYVHGTSGTDLISASQPAGWYNTPHVVTLTRNGSVGSIRVDGAALADNVPFSGSLNTSLLGKLYVGVANTGTFQGDVAEIRVYNTAMDSTQIASTESTLASTYGLTLVPEPSQYAMVFAGALLVGAMAMRYRRSAQA